MDSTLLAGVLLAVGLSAPALWASPQVEEPAVQAVEQATEEPAAPAAEAVAAAGGDAAAPADGQEAPEVQGTESEPQPEPEPELPTPELTGAEHETLAQKSLEAGDFDSAVFHWQRAIVSEPSNLRWGTDYRQAVIAVEADGRKGAYDQCIEFFEGLAKVYGGVATVRLNLGYAYVDKLPIEGAITQVILANKALREFTAALAIEESWLGFYTRGNSYMYWPPIFGRTELGLADLERALDMAEALPSRPYHGRAWAALGDGYWRLENRDKMLEVWKEGLVRYPDTPELKERLGREGEELDQWLERHFEPTQRVATHLSELFAAGDVQ
ncbi:MAG: tetratricopeptide repeat protein [Acidobacteriota bacterium]